MQNGAIMGLVSQAQLFNVSWTAHRLSPLHHSKDHRVLIGNQDALKTYGKRLHDLLAGDFLRSMQVALTKSLADDALSKAGSLVESRWEFISTLDNIQEGSDDAAIEMNECMGIFVTLDYEHIGYRAALLAGPDGYTPASTDKRRKQSTHLPLLLTRMPTALRNTFIEFISTTFDSYCATLHLPSEFLCTTLEASISYLMASESSQQASNAILEQVLKETQLTLSFGQLVAPSLKSLEISLPRETLSTFAHGGDNSDTSLFLSSLSQYLEKHLAMKVKLQETGNTDHGSKNTQHVWLSKVATAAFVLSTEGRFKLIDISSRQSESPEEQTEVQKLIHSANEEILRSLVRRAAGDGLMS
jgi:Kinetochore complex Sim4 subunit Fta1